MTSNGRKLADNTDMESRGILYEGANLSQLCMLFEMDHRTVVKKMHGVSPDGVRNRADIYKLSTAAPYLVKPLYDIESYIKNMSHNELPKMLTKEYWAGKRSRQEFEKQAGDLWQTTEVIQKVGELMKIFKNSARISIDAVDQQSQLSPKQREIFKQLINAMLDECHNTVKKEFTVKRPAESEDVYQRPDEDKEDDDDEL